MIPQVFFPEQEFPDLFKDVLHLRLFPDGKTFPDAIPKASPSIINQAYALVDRSDASAVYNFVIHWFDLPETPHTLVHAQNSIDDHIKALWPELIRRDTKTNQNSSKIPLPYKYVVPGGRFREIYYWDSYFTMLGLMEDGFTNEALDMVRNFAWMIEHIGHIPNGNRSYFLSRSQPPFFALMIRLLMKSPVTPVKSPEQFPDVVKNKAGFQKLPLFNAMDFKSSLLSEYDFWMDGSHLKNSTFRRVVKLNEGAYLNRYYDDMEAPRVESYEEDIRLYQESGAHSTGLYRELRAACESGWDFSSRWLTIPDQLSTIQTTQVLPVDLNVLLYILEKTIAELYQKEEEFKKASAFNSFAKNRLLYINDVCWNEHRGYYADYWVKRRDHGNPTLAMTFPLFAEIADQDQAKKTVQYLENNFLKPGGWVTTLHHTGHQWDAPNGWAPLQWITFVGLKNYGYDELANEGAKRWLRLNEDVFERTGRMMEKYNVEDLTLEAGGGEYPVQDGFGWTNGVYRALRSRL